MLEDANITELINSKKKVLETSLRTLYILEERRALYGIDTPPYIIIELEDLQEQIKKIKQEIAELERQSNELSKMDKSETPKPIDHKLRVFLCHSSQDQHNVHELYQRLLAEGWIDPWLDKEKLLPGQDWELEIEKSVEEANVVIICLSKTSVEKEGYYQKGIKKVLDVADEKPEGTIFIIPLRLDDCQVPRRLKKWQYEDYFPRENQGKAIKRLFQSLESRGRSLGIELKKPVRKNEDPSIELRRLSKDSTGAKAEESSIQQKKLVSQPHRSDTHSAILSEQVGQASGAGVRFVLAKLQWGKNDVGFSLHAEPDSYSTYGMQTTDFLSYLGFLRGGCSFVTTRECYSAWVAANFDLSAFARKFDEAYGAFEKAAKLLEGCGHFLEQPEGWGYFNGRPSSWKSYRSRHGSSFDGHSGHKTELLKQAEDDYFLYRMSWIEGSIEKGWIFHYRLKNPEHSYIFPALRFLRLNNFGECPYFEFEQCYWLYIQHENKGDSFFDSNANHVHGYFGTHEKNFSSALDMLIKANDLVKPFSFYFLNK